MAKENFYYAEGSTSAKELIKTLATEITKNAGIYNWDLIYPKSLDLIADSGKKTEIDLITDGSKTDKIETKINATTADDMCIIKATTTYGKEFYIKLERLKADLTKEEKEALVKFDSLHSYYYSEMNTRHRTDAEVLEIMAGVSGSWSKQGDYDAYVSAISKTNSINNIRIQFSDKLNKEKNDLNISKSIQEKYNYRLAWYRHLQPEIKEWLPIQYWLNVTKDSINLVLRGDPSADVEPYQNYLTSYAYIGALKPVEDSATTDDKYNFGVTVSSDIKPQLTSTYGKRTGTGVTDFVMFANKIGMPYQPHYAKFFTDNPFMDKCNVEGSRWNHKKHEFSDITLVHPVEMERGKMENVLVGDGSAINDTNRLAYKKSTEDEEYYKKFKITAPYFLLNNSANINYCLAIRCYKTAE